MHMSQVTSTIYVPPNWLDPLDWRQVFATACPIEVDIGCGRGAFLLWAAQARRMSNFLGVERLLVRLQKVNKKIQRLGLTNVRLIRVEASYCIGKLVPNDSVSVYHIYFPDPWPKRRHHRRRLFKTEFVDDLFRTLRKGGGVNVTTDDEDYFACIERVMAQSGRFAKSAPEQLPEEAMTEFERIFRAGGKPIFRNCYVRRG
jgi:tRNA (guanine-N7-)-methyltransferase